MANLFQYILIFFFISSNPLLSQNDSNIPKLPRAVIIAEQLAGKLVKLENEALVRYKLDPEKRSIIFFSIILQAGVQAVVN